MVDLPHSNTQFEYASHSNTHFDRPYKRKFRDLPCALCAKKCADLAAEVVTLMEEKVELLKQNSSRVLDAAAIIEKSVNRTGKCKRLNLASNLLTLQSLSTRFYRSQGFQSQKEYF